MIRKQTIHIHENGDVSYYYYRDKPLRNYLIEWPQQQVAIMDEDKIRVGGYDRFVTPEGYLQLSWTTPTIHEFTYKKRMKAIGLRFDENLRTKQNGDGSGGYWFWLTLDDGLSIDQRRSILRWDTYDLLNQGPYIQVPDQTSPNPSFYKVTIGTISISDRHLELSFHRDHNLSLKLFLYGSKTE